jgi:hypothetical protein
VPVLRPRAVVLRLRDVVPRRVPVERVPVVRARVPVLRPRAVVLRLRDVVPRRVPVERVPVERLRVPVLRLRDVPVERLRVPDERVPDVLRERLVEPARERVELPLREPAVALRARDVPDVERRRRVVPPVLRPVRAARTFWTPFSIFSSASDNCRSVELSWLGMPEVLLNG